jgi:hypothetical protein
VMQQHDCPQLHYCTTPRVSCTRHMSGLPDSNRPVGTESFTCSFKSCAHITLPPAASPSINTRHVSRFSKAACWQASSLTKHRSSCCTGCSRATTLLD